MLVVAAGTNRAAICKPNSACGMPTTATAGSSSRRRSVPTPMRAPCAASALSATSPTLKRAHERLLHDAVHDSLTGLPNRELFLDRLRASPPAAPREERCRPSVIFIDIDKFKNVNVSFGLVVGDSLLLDRRPPPQRHLGPHDTLARVGGDQFAILMVSETDPRELAMLAERVRRSLRAPIKIAGQEIVLTASIGIAVYDG